MRIEARLALRLASLLAHGDAGSGPRPRKPASRRRSRIAALKLDEIYRIAEGHAKAWKSDVVPARISNTTMGPLKPDGSAEAWVVNFFSPSANAHVSITTFRGSLTCYAQAGGAGRVPDLKPGFVLDGAKLYAIAQRTARRRWPAATRSCSVRRPRRATGAPRGTSTSARRAPRTRRFPSSSTPTPARWTASSGVDRVMPPISAARGAA